MFTVTVKPNSSSNSIELIKPGVYRIATTALPEKGAANQQGLSKVVLVAVLN